MALTWWAITLIVVLSCCGCWLCCYCCSKLGSGTPKPRPKPRLPLSQALCYSDDDGDNAATPATSILVPRSTPRAPVESPTTSRPLGTITRVTGGVAVGVQRRRVRLTLVLDKSGSMSGHSWTQAVSGVQAIVNVLDPRDTVTCITFNNQPDALCALEEIRSSNLIRKLRTVNCTGGTALYDAVALATALNLRQLVADAAVSARAGVAMDVHMVVVLTDGADNSSQTTAADVTQILHKLHHTVANCQTIFLGAGMDSAGERALRSIVAGVRDNDCKFFTVNQCDIADTFVKISITLERMARVEQLVVAEEGVAVSRADITSSGVRVQQAVIQR